MVGDSLGVVCHTEDLSGHCTVPLGLGRLGATTGSFMYHILVGTLVTYTRSGLFHQAIFSVLGLPQFSNGGHSSTNRDRKTLE